MHRHVSNLFCLIYDTIIVCEKRSRLVSKRIKSLLERQWAYSITLSDSDDKGMRNSVVASYQSFISSAEIVHIFFLFDLYAYEVKDVNKRL